MNKKKKFLIVFLLVNLLIVVIYINHFGVRAETLLQKMEKQANSFVTKGGKQVEDFNTKSITDNFLGLGQILTMVGAGVMVAAATYMGIKYIVSPPDKQAALKQQLIGLVVAGIVIFGAYGIWKAVIGVVSKF